MPRLFHATLPQATSLRQRSLRPDKLCAAERGLVQHRWQLLQQPGAEAFDALTHSPPPQRFEAGTPAIVEAIGFAAACDYVAGIGIDAIERHEAALVQRLRDALRPMNDVTLFGPEDSAGIVSFALGGVHPHDLGTILDEENVAIRAGHHCAQPLMEHLGVPATARASFGLYSDESDIDALVRGIERAKRIFA